MTYLLLSLQVAILNRIIEGNKEYLSEKNKYKYDISKSKNLVLMRF